MYADELFLNHLLFIANHRGSVRLVGRDIQIDGPTPALTSFVPGSVEAGIAGDCRAVRLAPWSGDLWPTSLKGMGFSSGESLSYMELADVSRPLGRSPTIEATVVSDEGSAELFAEIQSVSFATGDQSVDDWWADYFREQARLNYGHPAQRFYLGWIEGRAVTSTLALRSSGITGIYAVATIPEYRQRGVSAAVLERVRSDAINTGFPRLILQAMAGSYAEQYYSRLGFFPRYRSQVWRR